MRTRLLLLLVALGICAFAVEFGVRLMEIAKPLSRQYAIFVEDPVLPFRTAPDIELRGRSATGEYDFDYRHNHRGYRDEDHPQAKPEGVFRILGLGDSFTYGAGAGYEETYLRRLEKRLNENGAESVLQFEALKCGIPRFFPEPERMLLEHEGLKFEPDLILVAFVPNDVMDTYMGVQSVVVDDSGYLRRWEAREVGTFGVFCYKNSHVLRLMIRKYLDYQVRSNYTIDWRQVFLADGIYEDAWRKVEYEYDSMIKLAKNAGIPIAFLSLPTSPGAVAYYKIEDKTYPAARLRSFAARRGVPFFDSGPALADASKDAQIFWEKDTHCTPEGYRVIAEVLYEGLAGSALIPE